MIEIAQKDQKARIGLFLHNGEQYYSCSRPGIAGISHDERDPYFQKWVTEDIPYELASRFVRIKYKKLVKKRREEFIKLTERVKFRVKEKDVGDIDSHSVIDDLAGMLKSLQGWDEYGKSRPAVKGWE